MENFAAIDFETANGQRTSVCSVGVIIVKESKIVDRFYSLIRPEPNFYSYWNTKIHGITKEDTDQAPIFPDVWNGIESKIADIPLVAHNKAFDESCLRAVFKMYGMDYPDYRFYCTYRMAQQRIKGLPNYQLQTVSAYCGYEMAFHHHALDDAIACAMIARKIL